jgi:uncharacterized protein YndB with AHSA1/START domain
MTTLEKTTIAIQVSINASIDKVWECWTNPNHIVKWNHASDDWHTTRAESDLREGGRFFSRMEAKDGSWGFDFSGAYTKVEPQRTLEYTIDDGRKVLVSFNQNGNETVVNEVFEPEQTNSIDMQQQGWQAILDNFKRYVETPGKFEVLHFEIMIDASPEKVYQTMFEEKKWQQWTSEFNPTSHFQGTWEKGAKMLFLGSDSESNMGGVVSRIKENIPNEFVSIEHLGVINNGLEITSGPEVEGWVGALENYTFTNVNGQTKFGVDMDANDKFMSYFKETWPKALNKLKLICEQDD